MFYIVFIARFSVSLFIVFTNEQTLFLKHGE
jgi:hypothetical protein